ncbi:LytTR family DNA-binding domain-containing protein [Paenibacillus sp. YPG26]|uniref:LytTR family DNA-binding domain-containing protein n=1 Tax=Paenibacillus sp. YPG26 TaxID=2878915 RepID=UPI00203FC675|nr:LytTR family DNA-binding domain-containing protein [Paenibacillus sp. YPG26]USB33173.1 LytTR family transcriptional regulator DNA-binding domain-containing protein [Paenibacillus sp. YPG26]
MKVEVEINEQYTETTITVKAKEWNAELALLMNKLQGKTVKRLIGVEDEQSILLDPGGIDYVYSEHRKVFASIQNQRVELRMKLYEVEEILADEFTRFSKSVIGNLNQIERFELSFNGNLCVYFKSGNKEYVSRGYVSELKKKLIFGGGSDGQ